MCAYIYHEKKIVLFYVKLKKRVESVSDNICIKKKFLVTLL